MRDSFSLLKWVWVLAVPSAWLLPESKSTGPSGVCPHAVMFYLHLFTVGPNQGKYSVCVYVYTEAVLSVWLLCESMGGWTCVESGSCLVSVCMCVWAYESECCQVVCVCVLEREYEWKTGRQPTWALYPSRLLSAISCPSLPPSYPCCPTASPGNSPLSDSEILKCKPDIWLLAKQISQVQS